MKVLQLATALALAASLAAGPAAGEGVATTGIRQPGALTPAVSQPSATLPGVQQPARYAQAAPATKVTARSIQQPQSYAVPTTMSAAPLAAVSAQPIQQPSAYAQLVAPPSIVSLGATPVAEATGIIQQPMAFDPPPMTAVAASPAAAPAQPAGLQHPSYYASTNQQPALIAPPPAPVVTQPSSIAPPSAFASYYDEGKGVLEEEEDYRANEYGHDEDEDEEEEDYFDDEDEDEEEDRSSTFCGFELGGWVEQGFTFNPYDPQDGNNGTVVLNDLANQWQMNQLWFYADREVDNGGCGWDWGGRFDVLYGTDGEYFQMVDGLEESWGQNGQYQVALLRFYYDLAYNDWTLRVGRFDSLVGYEPFDATESFFYSRSYNFYAQPGSLLGVLLTRHLSEQLWVSGGLHRGDSQFDDTDGKDAVDFTGGFSWRSVNEETWLDAYLQAEEQGIDNDTLNYSVVGGTMLTEDIEYVCEWYWGQTDDAIQQAEWYGVNQHVMKEINDCWSHGFRFEWFRDDDGFIITDFARGNSAQGPFDGNFFEFTYAINYAPCENFVLRPEVRWDWYNASTAGPLPFDDGTKSDQFLLSIDAIYAF